MSHSFFTQHEITAAGENKTSHEQPTYLQENSRYSLDSR